MKRLFAFSTCSSSISSPKNKKQSITMEKQENVKPPSPQFKSSNHSRSVTVEASFNSALNSVNSAHTPLRDEYSPSSQIEPVMEWCAIEDMFESDESSGPTRRHNRMQSSVIMDPLLLAASIAEADAFPSDPPMMNTNTSHQMMAAVPKPKK